MIFLDTSALLAFLDRRPRHWRTGDSVGAHLKSLRRRSSLVDHVSFELMRRLDLRTALALDADFAREGFELFPD